jgi:hypothetical protein
LFVAHDAGPSRQTLSLCGEEHPDEFYMWRCLIRIPYAVDFRRIQRDQEVSVLDLSRFDAVSVIGKSAQIYRRRDDGAVIVVKSLVCNWGYCRQTEIANLSSLRHPLIAAPIWFALADGTLKVGRLHAAGGSLAEVIASKPAWWTPSAKAKTAVGIALALRFAHGFGLVHWSLKATNVLFDSQGRIQISDFRAFPVSHDGISEAEPLLWEDVSAFAKLLFEIIVGRPWAQPSAPIIKVEMVFPPDVPEFVSQILKEGMPGHGRGRPSFKNIVDSLKKNEFRIVAGVDFEKVADFVRWVESVENCCE